MEDDLFVKLGDDGSARCARWVLEEEDSEPAPFVALASASVTMSTPSPAARARETIHLDKLSVQLDEKGDGGSTRWILDTGATNHMTGERSIFSELDTGVRGTVRFGDGSVVAIEGRGTIIFRLKSGEH
uniref:Retrovirus-related Pol polyprotein from transposon TNT 1-94-like beta-barrel domain-containing protein n=1 Tax=Arundo donax TaxID=35708 RepID=A0A0A8XUW7_ARUDO